MKYEILFLDNTIFKGGNLKDTKWSEIPNKSISHLRYFFQGKVINLSGYDAYAHVIEEAITIIGNRQSAARICKVILMARKDNKVIRFIFDFLKNRFYMDSRNVGHEYQDNPINSWKIGHRLIKPKCEIK